MRQILYLISSLLCVGLLSVGCDSDPSPETPDRETVEVPVEFNLFSSGRDLTTRTETGPNPDTLNPRAIFVDRVNVYIYKRPSDQAYETDREGFVYSDKMTLTAKHTGTTGKDQPRFKARGKVPLESGYQYRMTAVAYSEGQGEDTLFALNPSYFDYAEISLEDKEEYKTPELFFGHVVCHDRDTLFRYEDIKDEQAALSGWLYRGVAGIELNLTDVATNVKRIDLLADSINTRVKARVYDDFLAAYGMQRDGSFQHFVIGSWSREKETETTTKVHIEGPNLLEICTSLSLRITLDENGEEKQVVCRLKVKENKDNTDTGESGDTEKGEDARLRSIPGDGGNGTGIIPGGEETPVDPENPDPGNKNPYRICFKRNYYYKLSGNYKKLTTMQYVIQVTVNPNWDGDVYLPLDKSEGNDESSN